MTLEQIQALSDDKLRIKVAELCGWVYGGSHRLDDINRPGWFPPEGWLWCRGHSCSPPYTQRELPNFPHDLNAIHEAEKILNDSQRGQWRKILVGVSGEALLVRAHEWIMLDATARQRAEAFVLTMQKESNE